MNASIKFIAAFVVLTIFLIDAQIIFALQRGQAETITVEAEGSGPTKMEALKSAWTEAVRKAVGMYTASKTEALNDDLTEQIAAYSRGQVNSYKVLSQGQQNGIWNIAIEANVDREIMAESIAANKSGSVRFDGSSIAAQKQTAADKKLDALDVLKTSGLADFSKCLDYSPSLEKLTFAGAPVLFMRHVFKINPGKFEKQAKELEKLLSQMASGKDNVFLRANFAQNALKALDSNDYRLEINLQDICGIIRKPNVESLDGILVFASPGVAMASYSGTRLKYALAYDNRPFFMPHSGIKAITGPGENIFEDSFFELKNGDMGRIAEGGDNICFLDDASNATCYKVDKKIAEEISNRAMWTISVQSKAGTGYASNLGSTQRIPLAIPAMNNNTFSPHTRGRYVFVAPALGVSFSLPDGEGYFRNGFYQTPVLIYYQKLDIPVARLGELKEINASYEISPLQMPKRNALY